MPKCRFFPWCSYTEGHGCTKGWCEHYQPMPDVNALKGLADEMQGHADAEDYGGDGRINAGCLWSYADRIREALGVEHG